MSHNKVKVGTAEANRLGEISPELNDLSNVAGAPSDGQYLLYSSSTSSWSPGTPSGTSTTLEHIWLGEGASQTYPEGWVGGRNAYFYAASPVNNISGASLASSDSFSNWYDEITIPSGTYFVQARVEGDFTSSSGVFRYITTTTASSTTTQHAASGTSASLASTNQNPDLIQALFEISATSVLSVEILSAGSSSLATSGMTTNQAQYGYLWIAKVG
jgi:hypothetical protein